MIFELCCSQVITTVYSTVTVRKLRVKTLCFFLQILKLTVFEENCKKKKFTGEMNATNTWKLSLRRYMQYFIAEPANKRHFLRLSPAVFRKSFFYMTNKHFLKNRGHDTRTHDATG